MQSLKKKKLIPLAFAVFAPLTLTTPKVNASAFGAEIFCAMRDGGNDHESSWDAAYTYIKKQKEESSKFHLKMQQRKLLKQL